MTTYAQAHAHTCANGARILRTATRWRGRQKVSWLFHYEGQDPEPREGMTLTTAHHRYAPEITEKVAIYLTPAETKRRKEAAQ